MLGLGEKLLSGQIDQHKCEWVSTSKGIDPNKTLY